MSTLFDRFEYQFDGPIKGFIRSFDNIQSIVALSVSFASLEGSVELN